MQLSAVSTILARGTKKDFHSGFEIMRICPDCHKIVSAVDSVIIRGQYYHKSCRVCHNCGKVIRFSKQEFGGHSYHALCLRAILKCCVCGKRLESVHTDWYGNLACDEHYHTCYYCGKIITPQIGGEDEIKLNNYINGERETHSYYICGNCKSSIINDDLDVERCRKEIMELFSNNGITGIPDDIPIELTDMSAEEEAKGYSVWGLNYAYLTECRSHYSFKISIFNELPELQFKSTLAHELLHSWLNLYAIILPENEKEGFCNLGSMLVYRKCQSDISDYSIYLLDNNDDPIYGDGYRLMKMRLDKLGWKGLMDALLREKKELM